MDKAKLALEIIERFLKVAEDLKVLSESIQAVCRTVTEALGEEEAPK